MLRNVPTRTQLRRSATRRRRTRLGIAFAAVLAVLVTTGVATSAVAGETQVSVRPGSTSVVALGGSGSDGSATLTYSLNSLPTRGSGVYTSVQLRSSSRGAYVVQSRIYPTGMLQVTIKRVSQSGKSSTITALTPAASVRTKVKAKQKIALTLKVSGDQSIALSGTVTFGGTTTTVRTVDATAKRLRGIGTAVSTFYTAKSSPAVTSTIVNRSVSLTTPPTTTPTPSATPTPSPGPVAPTPTPPPPPSATAPPKPPTTPTPTPSPSSAPPTIPPTTPPATGSGSGAGFPNASTTGVPAGVKLTRYDGDIVITKPNTVIDGLEVHGTITVNAPGAVIKNSKIVGGSTPASTGLVNNVVSGASFTIKDSELVAATPSTLWNGVFGSNFTAERVNVHGVVDPMRVLGGNVVIRDSWLHDTTYSKTDPLRNGTPTHDDTIQIQAGSGILIEGNRLEDAHNAGVMISQDASRSTLSDIVIRDNYLQGGACTINIAATPKTIRPQVTANVFGPQRIYATCAITAPTANAPSLSGNTWGATGLALTSFIVVQ